MEEPSVVKGQLSVQAKRCSLGYIVTVKLMICEPNGIGVKWHTIVEDVVTPPDPLLTHKGFITWALDAIKKKL